MIPKTSRKPRQPKKRFSWFRARGLRSAIGIDVGQFETKVVWLKRTASALEVACSKFSSFPISASDGPTTARNDDRRSAGCNPFKNQLPSEELDLNLWDPDTLPRALRRVAGCIGASEAASSDLAINLSMAACDIRGVCLSEPTTPNAGLLNKILRETGGDQRPSTIAILPNRSTDPSKLTVFSIPEQTALQVAEAFELARLRPRQLDGLPWSMQRIASTLPEAQPEQLVLVLDWSFGRPTLSLVTESEIKYVRRFSAGGIGRILQGIQRDFGMNLEESARWLDCCLQSDAQGVEAISETKAWARECCQQIALEIQTAMDFIRWKFRDQQVSQLLVIGGGGAMPGLTNKLQDMLDLQLRRWSTHIGDVEFSSEYAVAVSLACMGVSDEV